jgi:phospholipid/cholesterol/gamma-HCH transport system permease protein
VPDQQGYRISSELRDGMATIAVGGRIDVANAEHALKEIVAAAQPAREVVLDLASVDYFDSGGGAMLIALRQQLAKAGVSFRIARSNPRVDGLLSLVDQEALMQPLPPPLPSPGPARQVGAMTLQLLAEMRDLAVFTGEIMIGLWEAIRQPHRVRWRETLLYIQRSGADGLPIVALISYLMGLITAFQAAVQLTQFGADIYVANLVGISIVRELGPLMTAIIAAGRSGAAFAAEIGTMKVADEVDALTTMGLDRTRFLVTPKVVALTFMLPCLTLFADLVGIVGGLTVGVFWLDLPLQVYMRQTRLAMTPWDVYSGLVKSVAFAILIAGVGCLRGFQARGGAESVGRITTSAIVAGIFSIIVADAVFTVLFHYW